MVTLPVKELNTLKNQLEKAQKQAEDAKSAMLRARADLENARRRFEREREEGKKYSAEKTLEAIIPVVDDLDLALQHTQETEGPLVEGVHLVRRKFLQVLENLKLTSFK